MTYTTPIAIIGGPEALWVLAALLVLFGGRKLPELARAMGSSITQFKRGLREPVEEEPEKLTAAEGSDASKETS